jgi:hypothetical protein
MSCATACASILREVVRDEGARSQRLAATFFERQGEFLEQVWNLATGADFKWRTTEGPRPLVPPGIGAYFDLAFECAHNDAELRRHIAPVFYLTGPITLFFTPSFVAKVLLAGARSRLRARLMGKAATPLEPPMPITSV